MGAKLVKGTTKFKFGTSFETGTPLKADTSFDADIYFEADTYVVADTSLDALQFLKPLHFSILINLLQLIQVKYGKNLDLIQTVHCQIQKILVYKKHVSEAACTD